MKIGIIGFGRFGQFLAKEFVNYGWNVYATSRSDYTHIANELNVTFLKDSFYKKNYDIVILSVSINSLEETVKKIDKTFWRNKLVVDVLSVKEYPSKILKKYIPNDADLLLTHPMFGPDSAKHSWENKTFVYYPVRIKNQERFNKFFIFWFKKCNPLILSPNIHDKYSANSQFITHLTGRILENINLTKTPIDTDGFNSLLKLMQNTINDSWDLFEGLYKYNNESKNTINYFKKGLFQIENKLNDSNESESGTSILLKKYNQMKKEGKDIINAAIGIPDWKPDINIDFNQFDFNYGESSGLLELRQLISRYHKTDINPDNIIVTPGGKPALHLTLQTFTSPGDIWLIPSPCWVSYQKLVEIAGGSVVFIKTCPDNGWDLDIMEIEKLYHNNLVKGIIICHPNNPLGIVYSDEKLSNLSQLSNRYNKMIISDEVYLPLCNNNVESILNYNMNKENVIVINSFSKGWGLMGWRCGWITSCSENIKRIIVNQSHINTCTSLPSQQVAISVLKKGITPPKKEIKVWRDKFMKLFQDNGFQISGNCDSMYLFPCRKNIQVFIDKLLENGIMVAPGKIFGYENGFRMTLFSDKIKNEKINNILLKTFSKTK